MDTTQWEQLVAAYRAALHEEVVCLAAYGERQDAWDSDSGSRKAKPHTPEYPLFDISLPLSVAMTNTYGPDWAATCAAYEADLQAWQEREDAAQSAFLAGTDAAYEAASKACDAAFVAMTTYPAPSLDALAEKAALMTERWAGHLEADDAAVLIRDIRHLAGQEHAA